jgi:hypothetical protein
VYRYGAQGIDRTKDAQDLADQQWASAGSGMVTNGDKEALERRRSRILAYSVITLLLSIAVILTAPMTTCSDYRERAIEAAPLADLRYVTGCQEEYYVDNETYADSFEKFAGDCGNFHPNPGVVIYVVSADKNHYKVEAYHEKGKHLYEITVRDASTTIVRYEWKNQIKGAGKVIM